jgi:hypothetical protein
MRNNKHIIIYAALAVSVPVLLCLGLTLLGDSEDLGRGMRIFVYGLLLTILICPLYLMGLSLFFTIKKDMKFFICVITCTLVTFIVNMLAMMTMGLMDMEGIIAGMYIMTFSVFSAAAAAGSMTAVHAVNRRIRERLEEEGT